MPRFKCCGNPLHKVWSLDNVDSRTINLKTQRLGAILKAFDKLRNVSSRKTINPSICLNCLKTCGRRRDFTRKLEDLEALEKVLNCHFIYPKIKNMLSILLFHSIICARIFIRNSEKYLNIGNTSKNFVLCSRGICK